jgi:hypothetical protein
MARISSTVGGRTGSSFIVILHFAISPRPEGPELLALRLLVQSGVP